MTNVWFTADLHFGHAKVAGLRGFDDTLDHDLTLAMNWIARINEGDQVWVLGDLSGGSATAEKRALGLMRGLPGEKHLVSGNHDSVWPGHHNAHRKQRAYLDVFESVQAFAKRNMIGHKVLLSHFPYEGDHTEADRFADFRLKDMGKWPLHGHVHDEWQQIGRMINVGVDAWGLAPVPINDIIEIIRKED